MKKIFLFLSFLLMSIGVWGETSTLTFTAACGGSGTADDGSVWTVTSDAAESNYDGTKGVHYGTGKKAVSYLQLSTSDISGTITQIVVNASGASGTSAKLNITVGGSAFGSEKSLTSSATNYTLSGSLSGEIIVSITQTSATKALYCKSIAVTYSGSSPTIYTVTYDANGGSGTMIDSNSPYNSGSSVTVLSNSFTAPSGYEFGHWDTKADDSGTDYDAGNTFTITQNTTLYAQWTFIPPTPPTPIVSGKVFELLTDINDLNDGDNIIILNNRKDHALSNVQNTHNRGVSEDFRLIMGKTVAILNNISTVQIFRAEKENDLWQLYGGNGYIYSAGKGSGNNYLKTQYPNDNEGKWIITLDENNYATIISQGENTNNILLYNSSGLFSSYSKLTTATRKIYIYKESTFSETYTITLKNQLGPDSIKIQSNIGEIIQIPTIMNIYNDCYGSNWTLDGWVSSLETNKPIYRDEFIPTKDTILYALYSRGSIHPVDIDEYVRVTSNQSDWSGDYLIAYDPHIFANGQIGGGTGDGIGAQDIYFNPDENLINDVILGEYGDLYNISFEEVTSGSGTYLMKTKDGKYNYRTANTNGIDVTENRSTAESYPLTITFNSSSDIDISAPAGAIFHYNTQGYFRFYKDGG